MGIFISKNYLQTKDVEYMYIACEDYCVPKNNTYNLTCDYLFITYLACEYSQHKNKRDGKKDSTFS